MKAGETKGSVVLETAEEIEGAESALNLLSITEGRFSYNAPPPTEINPLDVACIIKGLRVVPALMNSTPEEIARAEMFSLNIVAASS